MTYLGMPCTWLLSAVCAATLAISGCSDDGTPATGDEGLGSTGSGGPQGAATSSVNTSDTVTASSSGNGDPGSDDDGPVVLDVPAATSGVDESGDDSGGTWGTGASDSDGTSGDPTGEPPIPACVDPQECSCNEDLVRCDLPPPGCPPDTVALIDDGTGCWEGSCVPIEACYTVDDCSWCDDDEACVSAFLMTGPQITCQPIDPGCADDIPTCECMPMACDEPFFECGDVEPGAEQDLNCYCPTC